MLSWYSRPWVPLFLFAGVCCAQCELHAVAPDSAGGDGQTQQPAVSQSDQANRMKPNPAPAQPKRILGVMPNYRAVSAGVRPPPPGPKEAFKIATRQSFDYSSFIFVGITSAMAEWSNTHPQLHEGLAGFGRYYWRGYLDKADGNYLVIFALPTILREDERYYAMGKGGIWKRGFYAATRILITPNYHGHDTLNGAEIFGRALSQGISAFYYPSQDRTGGSLAVKYGWAMGRDALTNVFREFWPDISARLHHHHQ